MPKACFDEGEHGFHPHIIIFTLINLFLSRPLTAQFGERGAPPPSVFPLLTTRFYGLSVPRPFLSSFLTTRFYGLSVPRHLRLHAALAKVAASHRFTAVGCLGSMRAGLSS
jgi:hypothetical protein